jgi:hypothetical protein
VIHLNGKQNKKDDHAFSPFLDLAPTPPLPARIGQSSICTQEKKKTKREEREIAIFVVSKMTGRWGLKPIQATMTKIWPSSVS